MRSIAEWPDARVWRALPPIVGGSSSHSPTTDRSRRSTDDWTTVTITEEPRADLTTNSTTDGGVFTNGIKLQAFNVATDGFVDVPRPSVSGAPITLAVCQADGSTVVNIVKLASDTDRQYRIRYFTDLRTLDGHSTRLADQLSALGADCSTAAGSVALSRPSSARSSDSRPCASTLAVACSTSSTRLSTDVSVSSAEAFALA